MAVDFLTAAVPAVLGTAIGYGLAIFFFKKTISIRYSEASKSSSHAKINFWCGVIAFIAIAQGLAGISHELLFALFNHAQIKLDNIYKGIFSAIFFPLIMLLLSFLLRAILKEKSSTIETTGKNEAHYLAALQEIKENRQREGLWAIAIANNHGDNNKATADYINTRVAEMGGKASEIRLPEESKHKNIYYFLAAIFVVGSGGGAYYYLNLKDGRELSFKTCTSCSSGKCESSTYHKTLLISNDKILTFLDKDGIQKIVKWPDGDDEKCTIVKEKGYAFECMKSSKLEYNGISNSSSVKFDGKNKYTFSMGLSGGGKYVELNGSTCDVE